MKEITGTLKSDNIIDEWSIFNKTVYSIDKYYLNLDEFVGKKIKITIEELFE